jgi:hypothetical protein
MWLFFFLAFLGCYAFLVAIVVSKRGNRRSHYGSYRAATGIYGAGYPVSVPVTVGGISASAPVAVAWIAVQAALAMWAPVHRVQESVACTSSGISS